MVVNMYSFKDSEQVHSSDIIMYGWSNVSCQGCTTSCQARNLCSTPELLNSPPLLFSFLLVEKQRRSIRLHLRRKTHRKHEEEQKLRMSQLSVTQFLLLVVKSRSKGSDHLQTSCF